MPFYSIDPLPELTGTVRIPIKDFARYEARLGREIRQEVFSKAMPTAGKLVRLYLEKETLQRKIFHRKRFARGWRSVIGNVASSVRVYNREKYASVIEYGRRPGARPPPSAALVPWVRDKLGYRGKQARSVAFLVARKIGERGIPARKVIRDPAVKLKVQKIVTKAVIERLKIAVAKTRAR